MKKKIVSAILISSMMLSVTACGKGGNGGVTNSGELNESTEQTSFTITGGQSALSLGCH